MVFVSVTRVRPRSLRFLLVVILHSWRSRHQFRGTRGFIGGYLASGPRFGMWTVTVWEDEQSMREYRNTGAHLKAMPKLIDACAEASFVHWTTDDRSIPSPQLISQKMKQGRTSKLRHPSSEHLTGNPWPDAKVPYRGPTLRAGSVPDR